MDFLIGTKILEERDSSVNGHIRVIKDLAWGVHIQAEGLTQSGGVVENIWRSVLKKISHYSLTVNHCLILGLGGGSAAKLVRKFWPEANITGIDIDPVMVEMGKKYLGLAETITKIVIDDAANFLKENSGEKYDLILVDLYQGDKYPKEFESPAFLRLVHRLITKNGCAVFNRLYFADKRPDSVRFGEKLQEIFSKVDYFYPEANIMFVCSR